PMTGFDSLCHSMSVLSTGGISTTSESIEKWNTPYVKILMTIFMFIGGVNFSLIYRMGTGHIRDAWRNEVLKIFTIVIIVATAVTSFIIAINPAIPITVESVLIDPLFQVVSMITSTGYTLDAFNNWGPVVFLIMLLLMVSGGCAGSTSGGTKIDRFIVLFRHCRNEIVRCLHPNSILSVRTNGKMVSRDLVSKSIVFLCLFVLITIAATIVLTAMGLGITHSLMLSLISITNSGITVPGVAVDTEFINIPEAGKWLLSLVMLIGRLEIFTVLLMFTPDFWRK
ncbi:MAG: TrkH family potassium uptake protein, partial [Muribaculaceae bacterium]|nr:TrkH family potassium uptake protein [Muribaculaceae bacterium]